VIGSVDGVLAIFRGQTNTVPWRKCTALGMITCVGVGDVLNQGKNVVICLTGEGICHIFDLQQVQSNESNSVPEHQSQTSTGIRPFHSQPLSLNIKTLLIASIDSAKCNDVFVGYTDRAVGAYRWDKNTSSLVEITKRLPLAGQVGSLSVEAGSTGNGSGHLLVAQAGGTYIPLVYTTKHASADDSEQVSATVELTYQKGSQDGVVGVAQRRNPVVCTEVVGGIAMTTVLSSCQPCAAVDREETKERERLTAICTLDGCIKLLKDESKQWELQVDHSLFSLHKLDITVSSKCTSFIEYTVDRSMYVYYRCI
jgi:hypothetical protein